MGNESSAGGQPTPKYPKIGRHRIWDILFLNLGGGGACPPKFFTAGDASPVPPVTEPMLRSVIDPNNVDS